MEPFLSHNNIIYNTYMKSWKNHYVRDNNKHRKVESRNIIDFIIHLFSFGVFEFNNMGMGFGGVCRKLYIIPGMPYILSHQNNEEYGIH
jgi:hypothetical protein